MNKCAILEGLEPRQLLSTFSVLNTNDAGADSLRQAILDANALAGADVIEFDASLVGGTITLTTGELSITDDLTITGLGAGQLAVSGNDSSRIFNNIATTTISGLTITGGNSGINGGGGILNQDTLTLMRTAISGNIAGGDGGGILNENALTLSTSTVSGNAADGDGGGIINAYGTLTLDNSTVSNNTASFGGGISNFGTVTLTNSTVSGNTAGTAGGGIDSSFDGTLTLTNSTIANNLGGGGLYLDGGTTTLTSTIVAGNTGGDILNGALEASSSSNLIQDAGSAGGLTNGADGNIVGQDPLLDDLAETGGPTLTHALIAGSPAIGAGSNPGSLTTDQRGGLFGRGSSVDIGAYQRQSFALVVDTLDDGDDGDYSAGNLSLREALTVAPNPGTDTITFDPSLNGGTILLGGTELTITGDISITGPGADLLAVSGNRESRVFSNAGETSISGLTITRGNAVGREESGFGGGIYNSGTLMLIDSTVSGSSAEDGGGIGSVFGDLALTNSTVSGNMADRDGGGISNDFGTLILTGTIVSGNEAGADGGGIEVANSNVTMTDSTVSSNSAGDEAGGLLLVGSFLQMDNSTVSGNTAVTDGGGMLLDEADVDMTNSTVSGNTSADRGGGLVVFGDASDSLITLTNSTIANNLGGGGLYLDGGTTTLTSTIVAGNTGGDILNGALEASSSSSLVQDAATSAGLINGVNGNIVGLDPMLGDLAHNGGSTMTHALLAGSPAIGTGSNPDGLTTDQRGTARVRGDSPDIGSFEANVGPTLGGLSVSEPELSQGDALTLAAVDAVDTDGEVSEVRFYLDSNGDGVGEEGELLGADADGSDGYRLTLGSTETAALATGLASFLAVAVDDEGQASSAQAAQSTVLFGLRSLAGGATHATSLSDGRQLSVTRNEAGDLIVLVGSGAEWTALRLNDATSAPAVTGDPIIWTDPNDGLAYVAAPASSGFLLFRRASDGTWTFRDLAAETATGAEAPVGTLTEFVSRPKTGSPLVYVAGINAAGEIVAYRQTTAAGDTEATWTLYNISDDLTSRSMTTPAFTQMTSYVTSWNQWTLAGLDSSGAVQGVWVNVATFTTWRVDNLSTITGAAPLTGELDVTLTTWGGIRFAGASASGRLVATWWNPALGGGNWRQTDLTAAVPGGGVPALSGGQLTAWFASGNLISYAGYDASGDIYSFYWQPSDGGNWHAENLTGSLPNRASRPAGTITSDVTATGESSILGASSDQDVVRLWRVSASDSFSLDNLSDLAVRV